MADSKRTPESRFWAKVNKTDGCWLWTASLFRDGYGYFRVGSMSLRAHRYSWESANGRAIPDGLLVCHTCDVPACVNPSHLFIGTAKANQSDASQKGRIRAQKITHCPKGHPYDEVNTWNEITSKHRRCRICRRGWYREWFRRCRAKTGRRVKSIA